MQIAAVRLVGTLAIALSASAAPPPDWALLMALDDLPEGRPTAPPAGEDSCVGDVTGNGTVNPIDLAALLVGWGTDGNGEFDTDCNDDGIVDSHDLAIVLADWGTCP